MKQTAKQLGVDLGKLLQGGYAASPATLQLEGRQVLVSGRALMECSDEIEAVVALCLAHSVLNVKFPRGMAAFLGYIQKYVLGIDDGIKPPQRCLRFVQQLAAPEPRAGGATVEPQAPAVDAEQAGVGVPNPAGSP